MRWKTLTSNSSDAQSIKFSQLFIMASLTLPTIQDDVRVKLEAIEDMLDKIPDSAYLNSKSGPTKRLSTFGSNSSKRMMFNRSPKKVVGEDQPEEERMSNAPGNSKYKQLFLALRSVMTYVDASFTYTTIQVNKNSMSVWHKDKGNVGDSYGVSLGDFTCEPHPETGELGDLWMKVDDEVKCVDYRYKFTRFNAAMHLHRTNETVTGKRYAILFFTHTKATKLDAQLNFQYLTLRDTVDYENYYQHYVKGEYVNQKIYEHGIKHHETYAEVYHTRMKKADKANKHLLFRNAFKKVKWKNCGVFIINLKKCKDRKKHMDKHLKKFRFVNYAFQDAVEREDIYSEFVVDGKIDQTKVKKSTKNVNKALGEIACVLSHLRILEIAIDFKLDNLVIMEDDINFEHEIFQQDTIRIPLDTEFCQIGWGLGDIDYYQSRKATWLPYEGDIKSGKYIFQSHCYMLTSNRAIKKLYELYKPYYPGKCDRSRAIGRIANWSYDVVLTKAIFPQMKTYLLRLPVEQLPLKVFPSHIRGKEIMEQDLKQVAKKANAEVIHIAYVAKQGQKGGWRSFIVHLYHCLNQMENVKPVVVRCNTKTGKINSYDFGYDVPCIGMKLEELAKQKHVLIACMSQDEDQLHMFKGKCIVVHDPIEVPKYNPEDLKNMKVFVIRQSMREYLEERGITSRFLYHPFYKFPVEEEEKSTVINTARVCSRKRTKMIMEANLHYENEHGEAGYIEIHSDKDVCGGGDFWVSSWNEELQGQFNASYKGGFPMTFEATEKVYRKARAVVDMSRFNGDGGGTQYTFLEAIHCGCALILHEDWLEYPGPFVKNINCLTVSSAMDLAACVIMLQTVDDIFIDAMVENSKKLLNAHDNGDDWANYIMLDVEPPKPKKKLKIVKKKKAQVQFIQDLFDTEPSCEEHLHGWLGHGNKAFLTSCVKNKNIKVIVELGSWYGKSAHLMMTEANHDITLFCVDKWSGEDIKDGNQVITAEKFGDMVDEHPLYETFIKNLWEYKDKVVPLKMTTLEGLKVIHKLGVKPDVVYVDANHTYDDVKAEFMLIKELFPKTQICGDDYNFKGVEKAVEEMAVTYNMKVSHDELTGKNYKNFWSVTPILDADTEEHEETPISDAGIVEQVETPISDSGIAEEVEIEWGIQDPRCNENDMWGTPPEWKQEYGYDESWFDPNPYPPAPWDAREVDWFTLGNKFFVNPPYDKKLIIQFLEKIVATYEQAKRENRDLKIHVLLPLKSPGYLKKFENMTTSTQKVWKRIAFINLHTGIQKDGFSSDLEIWKYENEAHHFTEFMSKVIDSLQNHPGFQYLSEEKQESMIAVQFRNDWEADEYHIWMKRILDGEVKDREVETEVETEESQDYYSCDEKPESPTVDLKVLAMEREERLGKPSREASSKAKKGANIMYYDDLGKKVKESDRAKRAKWRAAGKGNKLK